ncbi:TonB-dependent receptor [Chitinophagaceae bacterium MMS25-I14]
MKKNTTKLSLFLFFSCLAAIAQAHTGSIKGYVYDGKTHKPLEGVSIYIKELNSSAVSDAFGSYFLKGLKDGKCTVIISHVGYGTIQENIKIEDGITADLSTDLISSEVRMQEVAINARKDMNLGSISAIDIKMRPINTTQDMMRMVPGLFTSQHQGGGKAEQMFLRGFDADHGTDINVNVDGMPVNMVSHAHGQGYADVHFIIPELVEKIDFGKGPYRIDKGDFTTAGWAEFKTRDHLDNNFVKLEGGTFGYFRTVAGLNLLDRNTNNNQEAYIAGEYGYNRSYFDAPQNFNRVNLTGKYTNFLSKDKILSITATGFHTTWDASGQVPERAVAEGIIGRFGELDGEGGNTSRYNLNIQYQQAINNHSHFKSNLYTSYYDFELYSDFTFFLNDPVNGDQIRQKEKRLLTGYNADYTNNYSIGGLHTKTEAGLGFRYDDIMGLELSHTVNRTTTLKQIELGDVYQANAFGYINQSFYLLPQLVVTAGTRFDYFIHNYDNKLATENTSTTYTTHAFSPKAGIYYNFGNSTRIYFNYGTGFHSNDTRAVIANEAKYVLPLVHSYDLGIVMKPYSRLLISAAVFQLNMQQEFVYGGDNGLLEPSGRTRRTGADLSLRWELLKWLYLDADFNYTKARYRDEPAGQNYLPLAPGFTSIGGATVKVNKNINAGVRYRHMGDRPANEDNTVTAPGYTVFDAVVNYSRPKYELALQVQNLFNTTWNEAQFYTETRLRSEAAPASDICFTPGTPLFLKLSATWKF